MILSIKITRDLSLASVFREIAVADGEGCVLVEHVAVVSAGGGSHIAEGGAGIEEVLQVVGSAVAQRVGFAYHLQNICFIQQVGVYGSADFIG